MMGILSERLLLQSLAVKPQFIGGTLRVNKGYRGPIMQIWNGTTTLDVGSCNDIPAFCGASNGTVVTLYDQSGNGRDYTQVSITKRPKIYDGATTSLLRTNTRGPIVIRFDGVDDALSRSDSCGLSGDVSISVYHLAKANAASSGSYCHFGTNLTNKNLDLAFITGLSGVSGRNVSRATVLGIGGEYYDDGVSGAKSNAFHYDVVERGVGEDILNLQWQLNGTTVTSANEGTFGVGPNFNNLGSDIGLRAALNSPLAGDIALLGMWSPRLTTADKTVLNKFSEGWRIQ